MGQGYNSFTMLQMAQANGVPADNVYVYDRSRQTNSVSVGLSNNWVDVAGSTAVTQMIMTVNPAQGAVFYRMR